MTREEYGERVVARLRRLTVEEQQAVRSELDAHIEDHICALLESGCEASLAEERTLEQMGDPAEVGRAMNRQYPLAWLLLGRMAAAVTVRLCILALLSIGMLGFFWDSLTWRIWPPEPRTGLVTDCVRELDIRVNIGSDVLHIYQVSLGRKGGVYQAEAALCTYDRIPGGIVSRRLFPSITAQSQRGETWDGSVGGGGGHWLAERTCISAPIRSGDDHITLRYERFGETRLIEVPLVEGGAP